MTEGVPLFETKLNFENSPINPNLFVNNLTKVLLSFVKTFPASALKIINQNPENSLLLNECARRGKFNFDFELIGDSLEPLIISDFHY